MADVGNKLASYQNVASVEAGIEEVESPSGNGAVVVYVDVCILVR